MKLLAAFVMAHLSDPVGTKREAEVAVKIHTDDRLKICCQRPNLNIR